MMQFAFHKSGQFPLVSNDLNANIQSLSLYPHKFYSTFCKIIAYAFQICFHQKTSIF